MRKREICLVAVDIRSAHNVGAFFRTCDGFSAQLILTGITPRPLRGDNDQRLPHIAIKADKTIAKTALGAEKTVNWQYYTSLDAAINYLKNENFKIIAIEQNPKSNDIAKINDKFLKNNIALIVGPEVTGLDYSQIDKCDEIFEIPMSGQKESFNVSIAAAIALYETSKT